jgi:hypothetical protein
MLKIEREIELGKFYRLGKEAEGKIRPIVASFSKMRDRQDVRYAAPRHKSLKKALSFSLFSRPPFTFQDKNLTLLSGKCASCLS